MPENTARLSTALADRIAEDLKHESGVQQYEQFVESWSDADAESQPLVDDARQRIARLRSSQS